MPVILGNENEDMWLNHDSETDQLLPLLKPFPDEKMEELEVGAAARDQKNDYPEIINPHKTSTQGHLF
jgi:putative SOS response-associated peptidase YedK